MTAAEATMKHSTTDDERGELPTCLACGRTTEAGSLVEKDPEEGELRFCDVRCREDYFTRMDKALEDDRDAA
jgi:hypothetical protein